MSFEEKIKQELENKFSFLAGKITITRPRRIFLDVDINNFYKVFDYAVKQLRFPNLCAITGLDDGDKLSFIYHLGHDNGTILNVRTSVPKENPVLKTVMNYFPSAEIYEREVVDLLGAKVEGLPEGARYPLTDDWPAGQYPLRKDWKSPASEPEGGIENA